MSLIILTGSLTITAQKTFTDGIIVYNIAIQSGNDTKAEALSGATTTVYLKGAMSRTDMISALGTESTILDNKAGSAVILKEYSGQKLMITLTKDNWSEKNKKFDNVSFTETSETKTVNGYSCKKATATLDDGTTFVVYYSNDLVPVNKAYNVTFKNLPGLAIEYEYNNGKTKYIYTMSKIGFDGVQASKFDIPKAGYRTMTYEENKLIKKGS